MWVVIQITETGEEFGLEAFRSQQHAWAWIEDNADNYPESDFRVEKE